jgi:hypothetical protein
MIDGKMDSLWPKRSLKCNRAVNLSGAFKLIISFFYDGVPFFIHTLDTRHKSLMYAKFNPRTAGDSALDFLSAKSLPRVEEYG